MRPAKLIAGTATVVVLLALQAVNQARPNLVLSVTGSADKTFTSSDFAALPHTEILAEDMDGKTVRYGGVLLIDLLLAGGAAKDSELRGKNMAFLVVAEARDSYKVVFSLAELSPGFTNKLVLVADTMEGKSLSDRDGPYRLVVPGDRRKARWLRMLQKKIRLERVE